MKKPEERIAELEQEVGKLTEEIKKINSSFGALEAIQKNANSPNQFMILAMFDFGEKAPPKEIADLQNGAACGLPSLILHRWCPEEPCGKILGNLYARKPVKKDIPADKWKWSHVGARIFPTRAEADTWLAHSQEGELFTRYADLVMGVALTDYGQL